MMRKFIIFKPQLFQRPQLFPRVILPRIFHGKYNGGQHLYAKKKAVDNSVCQQTGESLEPNYKVLTMDDMLVPSGCWKAHYKKRNSHYNRVLIFGVVSLIGSLFILQKTVFFNAFPPPYPFIIEEKEEGEPERECKCEC